MGSTDLHIGRRATELARKLFPILAVLTIFLSIQLFLVFMEAFDDYGMHGCTPPDPRCLSDLSYINQVEFVAVLSFVILALGLAYNRRRKGAVYLALILVMLVMAVYMLPFLV